MTTTCSNCGKEVNHPTSVRSQEFMNKLSQEKKANYNDTYWLCDDCAKEDESHCKSETTLRYFGQDIKSVLTVTASVSEESYIYNKESIDMLCNQLKLVYDNIPFSYIKWTLVKKVEISPKAVSIPKKGDSGG